jgi:hypothetical protein
MVESSKAYIEGRWGVSSTFRRPQAIAWSNNFGTLDEGTVIPEGVEGEDFIILSDHNRSGITVNKQRIENRKRLINASMRSYHVADKRVYSVSWDNLPSRSYNLDPAYGEDGKPTANGLTSYTVDGGSGGVELLNWYENHPGPFYMFLAYDKYNEFSASANLEYTYLKKYNEIVEVYFSDFTYDVVRRGINTHDFWNITVSLEEV